MRLWKSGTSWGELIGARRTFSYGHGGIGGDIVARYLHDTRAGRRHDLGGIALVVGEGGWGRRVGSGWNVRGCGGRSGKLRRLRVGQVWVD